MVIPLIQEEAVGCHVFFLVAAGVVEVVQSEREGCIGARLREGEVVDDLLATYGTDDEFFDTVSDIHSLSEGPGVPTTV